MNKIQHQAEHFSQISSEYYSARQNKNHLFFKRLLFGYMLQDVQLDKNKQMLVLEPMCGYGEGEKIVRQYLTDNILYEGFDYDDLLIERVKSQNPDTNIYKQDVTRFCADKKYDIIILIGGLHHVPEFAAQVCSNLSAALKKGGIFLNFEPTNNNLIVGLSRKIIYKRNHIFDEKTERAFSLKELNRLFLENGFKIKKQFFPGLLAYILYYNPDAFPGLNLGTKKTVKKIFNIEKANYKNWIGRWFSFCTFTILTK